MAKKSRASMQDTATVAKNALTMRIEAGALGLALLAPIAGATGAAPVREPGMGTSLPRFSRSKGGMAILFESGATPMLDRAHQLYLG